jgi:hypothetical protein
MSVILAMQETEIRRIVVQSQSWGNSFRDPISKKSITKKKGWQSGSSDECLPSKCEALSSSPSAEKKKGDNPPNSTPVIPVTQEGLVGGS